jgi:hypothetical protein
MGNAEVTMNRTVTLLVHGTFAAEAKWWRLGTDGERTFADRLEDELSRRGVAGSVWKPALAEGFDYSSFTWSGRNRHRDRVKGAMALSANVNRLAERAAATTSEPLTVNFVAHSHGGNVVLEALRHLRPNVRVGRIALLGTPLVTVKPAFRVARFVFSTAILALFALLVLLLVVEVGTLFISLFTGTPHFLDAPAQLGPDGQVVREGVQGGLLVALLFPTVLAYGWLFWMFGNLLDVTWRVLSRIFQPLAWWRGRASSLVYGPSPRKLAKSLGGTPILLLTTHNDEADLLLQIGSAPTRLYREYVATEFSRLQRLLEFVLLRPFVLGVFLKAAEMLLEVLSLGCSKWRSLLYDFEIAPNEDGRYYPSHLLVHQKIDVRPGGNSANGSVGAEAPHHAVPPGSVAHRDALRLSLREVTNEITRQIQLRHSAYYENQDVLRRVGEFLTGVAVNPTAVTDP